MPIRTRPAGGALGALLCVFCLGVASSSAAADDSASRRHLDALVASYPDFLAGHDGKALVWRDGTRMPIDDGIEAKDFDTLLNEPDLEDQFYAPYPAGRHGLAPKRDIDPGRVRYEPFFKKMYGDCKKGEVRGKLVSVAWLANSGGMRLKVTGVNGVADRLRAVSAELEKLPRKFLKYLTPSAGTYACRTIAGTGRFSVHAFGAAIDINVRHADYWRWRKPDWRGLYAYRNRVPWEIVEIFERHGFIWGGKWYHYDTMHFEYRPELLRVGTRP